VMFAQPTRIDLLFFIAALKSDTTCSCTEASSLVGHATRLLEFSECELEVNLHPPGRLSGNCSPEERRSDYSDVRHIVYAVQRIKRIEGHRQRLRVLAGFGQCEIMRHVEVEIDDAWTVHGVPWDIQGTIVDDTIAVIVTSGDDVDRQAGIDGYAYPQHKKTRRLR